MYKLNLDTPESNGASRDFPNPPSVTEASISAQPTAENKFYVVSLKKFYILFIGTMGAYMMYWFYRHWRAIKAFQDSDIWPIPRTIFMIFFTHNLFDEIQKTLIKKSKNFKWPMPPMVIATLLVIATIISNGADRYSMHSEKLSVIDFLSLILLPLLAWGTAQAQKAANIADDDAEGLANDKLSTANYIWIALFGFIWVAILYGLYVYLTVVV